MNMNLLLFPLLMTVSLWASSPAYSSVIRSDQILKDGFTPIQMVDFKNISQYLVPQGQQQRQIQHFCETLNPYFAKYRWDQNPCGKVAWQSSFRSLNGHPLIFAKFGDRGPTTLILSAVHPDELTPVPMGFRLARYLQDHPDVYQSKYQVIIAPLVNPDGFIRNVPSRTNANGVDPNRNFLTLDWYDNSKKFWQGRKDRRTRHYPGYFPNSEIETLFQMKLIESFEPSKILSVHAPLGFYDYDAPPPDQDPDNKKVHEQTTQLVREMSKKSDNYRVVNFSIYPGSLGNYAGHERNIMTITLELKTTESHRVDEYWQQFLPGMLHSIAFDAHPPKLPEGRNASNFLTMLFDFVDWQKL